jgi:2,4-dienoyl-CoA reductase (NADPH2)
VGGERLGLVTAEHLASRGAKVTLIEPGSRLAEDVTPTFRWRHAAWVKEMGIEARTGVRVVRAERGRVVVAGPEGETAVEADAIVWAGPRQSRNHLLRALDYACDELYVIGDAVAPRSLPNAIHEGFRLGARI